MDPNRTALLESDLGSYCLREQIDQVPYCLQYRLLKNVSRRQSRQQQLKLAGKR